MKKVLSMIMTTALVLALFGGSAYAGNGNGNGKNKFEEFKDMKGHWGQQSVQKMQSFGIFNGYPDGTFRPDSTLTQAELAVIIDRLIEKKLNSTDADDEELTDVSDDDEDLDNVPAWAKKSVKKGIKHGYFDISRFHSHVQVSRLQSCVEIAMAMEDAGLLKVKSSYDNNPFKDKELFKNPDHYRYIMALYEAGYIKGNPNGNFNPNAFLNRAEMASIIANLIGDDDEDSDDDIAPDWDKDSYITAAAITSTHVKLKWNGADTDAVQYKVSFELKGEDKEIYTTDEELTVKGLTPDKLYEFEVQARDVNKNWSNDGPSVKVTTLDEAVDTDVTAPTWPSGSVITEDGITTDSIALEWDAAKDDIAVTGYEVKVYNDGALEGTFKTADNDIVIDDLDEGTDYTFQVRAYDAAGNKSIRLTAYFTTDEI